MDTPKSRFPILPTLAGAALLTLLVLPATRWILLTQFKQQLLLADHPNPAAMAQVARNHANDYPIQLAEALIPAPLPPANEDSPAPANAQNRIRLAHLQDLAARFPDNPSAHANIMRYLTMGEVKLHRDEETLYSGGTAVHKPGDKTQSDAEYLAIFEKAAEAGERLDPDNSFFPMMHAISLFDQHQDDEAIAALKRAGESTRWEDYYYDEIDGRMRLETEVHGEQGAIHRMATQAAILFPHFASLRGTARMAMYKATEAELAGHAEEGVAIRHAVMHSGSLLRAKSRSYIGTLVGIAITAIGTGRPGGAPLVKPSPDETRTEEQRKQLRQERLNRYYTYLRSLGHEEEARWAQAEIEAGNEAKKIGTIGLVQQPFNSGPLTALAAFWAANIVTLSNLMVLLALGAAAGLATRIKPKKGLGGWRLAFCLLLAGGILAWQWGMFNLSVKPFYVLATEFASMSGQQGETTPNAANFVLMGLGLFVPFLSLLILSIVSKVERIPLATGLGRGLRRLVLPLGSLLFLVYGGLLLGTLRQEAKMNQTLMRIEQNEGQYFGEVAGKPWPGLVP